MIYFPQLSSGSTGQFPIKRQRVARTVVNQSCQGYQVKLADAAAAITDWHLSFDEMSDQELAAIEALFQTVEGQLTPFTFLDPTDNLLTWSEEQTQPAWQGTPLLALVPGIGDPMGGTAAYAVSNPTSATLTLQQSINAPASLSYCVSLYARSDQSTRLWLLRGASTDPLAITSHWTRLTSAGQSTDEDDSISFGIALDPGATVDIFGVQAEAQIAASGYKRTAGTGGVYPNARFRDDTLTITTVGPGRHSCELDIVNVEYL